MLVTSIKEGKAGKMFSLVRLSLCFVLASTFFVCVSAKAQENNRQRTSRTDSPIHRPAEPSDLAKDNFDRVAASAAQVREVLVKDAGILVELKRWVAKEATDNGQIVEDSSLTDDAIFERLEKDIVFRSLATRLVQRYGYLLPSVNPNSDAAKEQDYVLKERARRLVQVEGQEDAEALQAEKTKADESQKLERTATCDSNQEQEEDCREPSPNQKSQRKLHQELPDMEQNQPNPEQIPRMPNTSPLLQASSGASSSLQSQLASYPGLPSSLSLSTDPSRGSLGALSSMGAMGSLGGLDALAALRPNPLEGLPMSSDRGLANETNTVGKNSREVGRFSRSRIGTKSDLEPAEPVALIHRPNPYADVPSLYDMYVQAASRDREPERFGLKIFRNGTREPDAVPMDLPVGPDYVVGPGDGLAIDLWGGVTQRLVRTVDREGRVMLPEAGPLLVSGRNLGEVQQAVQQVLRTQFQNISADVSLSRLRTIRVYVVGEVAEPGAYDISSLSTPLNALFAAGGVTSRGSLRALKHYRGKQLIEEVDAYDLLLRGVGSDMKRLENGDSLLVPPMGAQVTVSGMVRRPAIYELHGEKTLADTLDLAGGILPAAALQHIEVQRLEAHEKRTMLTLDLSPKNESDDVMQRLDSFKVQDGDQIHIFPIAPYNESAIFLQGHVLRPGRYSYREGMKITDVISSYNDLLPEPSGRYAEIVRLNAPDYHPSVESFDLSAALANPATAPKLQPLDTIRVFSRYDFEPAPDVWVGGEVRAPGKYRTSGQAHLRDAIFLAGGTSPDAALDTAQLFRTQTDGSMKILSVNLGEALAGNPVDNLVLQPRDRVLIHRNSAKVDPATVYIKGEVAKPGRYPLTSNMHVQDLIHLAGGLKRSADMETADLTRYQDAGTQHPVAKSMDVKLSAALSGDAKEDNPLEDGDVLTIRRNPGWDDIGAMVTLKGEVNHPGSYGIHPGEKLSSVLLRANGFSAQAYPYGAILTRRDVRETEVKSHMELVQRVKAEEVSLKSLPEGDQDQKNAKMNAIAQTETAITQLQETMPIGRVVIHIRPEIKTWQNTGADVALRDGDVLIIPKKADYILVNGQVYNPTAVSYQSSHSAKWYLSQAGGLTPLADKKAVFVIRADGSVLASKNNSGGWWSGDPLGATLRPGDSIVVPEKAPKIGGRNWTTVMQSAQLASSIALAVAYIHP
jgi:protein involved in polysaccharide export with SLBB domain